MCFGNMIRVGLKSGEMGEAVLSSAKHKRTLNMHKNMFGCQDDSDEDINHSDEKGLVFLWET